MDATSHVAAIPASSAIYPPGPFYWEPFRIGRTLLRDPLGQLMRDWRAYGDSIATRIWLQRYYLFIHPDHAQHVLHDNHRNYVKGPMIGRVKVLIGEGLFTSEGDFWRRQRRLAQPAFHRQRIARFGEMMVDCGRDMLDGWAGAAATGDAFDLASEMSRVTLRIVGRALFSLDLQNEAAAVGKPLADALDFVTRRAFNLFVLPMWLPTSAHRRFHRARAGLDDVVLRIIEHHRALPSAEDDLLTMLLAARDPDTDEGMTDRQLRDEVMTFVLAGHETTAVTLSWAWYLLATHPATAQRLRDEVTAAIGRRSPTLDDLPRLTYARTVVEETMRLYPPVWGFGRQALQEDVVGPYRVAAGTPVNLCPWLTHRHPDFWPDPERFDPDRFTPDRAASRHRFAYLPFSAGPRTCIGNEFAMMELVLLLTLMAQRYRVTLVEPGSAIEPDAKVTLRPRGGVAVRIAPA